MSNDLETTEEIVNYKKASAYYMIGTLVNKGMAFISIPIFTRLLSTSDYGIVNTYNSWMSIVGMFIGCALYMGIRLAFLDYENTIDDFMSVIVTYTLAGGGVCALGYWILSLFFGWGAGIGILCILHGTASMLVEDYSMYLQMKYRYKMRTALLMLPNLISVVISIILICCVINSDLYMGRIVPNAAICLLAGVLIAVTVYRKSRLLFSREYLGYAMRISLPLVVHGIALNILSQSDRIMITNFADSSQSGIYSLIYNYGMAAAVITTGFQGIWEPWLLRNMKEKKDAGINRMAGKYIKAISFCMVGVIMVGPEVVKLFAASSYWEGISIIPPIVLANYVIFAYTFYVSVEHFYKKTIGIALNTIVAAASNLILNFMLIPKYGYFAAAYTTVASYIICFALHVVCSKRLDRQLFPIKIFAVSMIQIVVAVVLFYLFMDSALLRWGLTLAYAIVSCLMNRDEISIFLKELNK